MDPSRYRKMIFSSILIYAPDLLLFVVYYSIDTFLHKEVLLLFIVCYTYEMLDATNREMILDSSKLIME